MFENTSLTPAPEMYKLLKNFLALDPHDYEYNVCFYCSGCGENKEADESKCCKKYTDGHPKGASCHAKNCLYVLVKNLVSKIESASTNLILQSPHLKDLTMKAMEQEEKGIFANQAEIKNLYLP